MDHFQALRASTALEWAALQKASIKVNKHCK